MFIRIKLCKHLVDLQGKLQTKLLCGSDLVESFLRPGVWNPDQLKSILEEHGVVCISRYSVLSSLQKLRAERWLVGVLSPLLS